MPAWITAIDPKTWLLIAAAVYLILPANSPIKAFLNRILGPILGPIIGPQPPPGPTPVPGPVPTPGPGPAPSPGPSPFPIDIAGIIQVLLSILLKAKATANPDLEKATTIVLEHVQNEQKALQSSTLFSAIR